MRLNLGVRPQEVSLTWSCKKCGAEVDDELDMCWQCGVGRDGSPPPEGWRSELAVNPEPAQCSLHCLRCQRELAYAGRKRFHDSSYAREALLGEFFVNREELDMYICRGCGKAEFYAPEPAA
jgi:hypothetical protein